MRLQPHCDWHCSCSCLRLRSEVTYANIFGQGIPMVSRFLSFLSRTSSRSTDKRVERVPVISIAADFVTPFKTLRKQTLFCKGWLHGLSCSTVIGGFRAVTTSKTNLAVQSGTMADVLQSEIVAGEEAIMKQGDTVRSMKASLKEGKAEKVCCL